MARGATWDVSLEERIGHAIGLEGRALDANFFGGVCINLPRHPAWGRVQETYSEDPILLGAFGAALTRGVQKNMVACGKHYALNSMENARFKVDVSASEEVLQEVYLPHFRKVVEEGAMAIMSAYNSVNGEWAGQNEMLFEEVLRKQWGFKGVTVSDFIWGLRSGPLSLKAGLDIEEPFAQARVGQLRPALEKGDVATWAHVDRAALRILSTQIRHYSTRDPSEPSKSVVFSAEHRALAHEAAAKSMVLLQNQHVDSKPILPLDPTSLSHVAVIGRLANAINTGDGGSSSVKDCPEITTAYAGIKSALPSATITLEEADSVSAARAAAEQAEVSIVIVGYTAEDEGEFIDASIITDPVLLALYPDPDTPEAAEAKKAVLGKAASGGSNILGSGAVDSKAGGDRESIRLRPLDAEIIRAVHSVCPRTIVAVVTAGAVIMEEWKESAPGLLLSWYSGSEGGHALADVLLGKCDASGRLPYSIPTTEEHLPYFDMEATSITYDKWHGQRLLDRKGWKAAFPLGFGLSYTTFSISDLSVEPKDPEFADSKHEAEMISLTLTVTNTGSRPGRYIVQVYGKPQGAGDDFPSRALLGFAPADLEKGEKKNVSVSASTRPLKRWKTGKGWEWAGKSVVFEVGGFSGDEGALTKEVQYAKLS